MISDRTNPGMRSAICAAGSETRLAGGPVGSALRPNPVVGGFRRAPRCAYFNSDDIHGLHRTQHLEAVIVEA